MIKKAKKILALCIALFMVVQVVFAHSGWQTEVKAVGEKGEIVDFYLTDDVLQQYFTVGENADVYLPTHVTAIVRVDVGDYTTVDVPVNWTYTKAARDEDNAIIDSFNTDVAINMNFPYYFYPTITDTTDFKLADYKIADSLLNGFQASNIFFPGNKVISAYVQEKPESNTDFEVKISDALKAAAYQETVYAADSITYYAKVDGELAAIVTIGARRGSYLDKVPVTIELQNGYLYKEDSIQYKNSIGTATLIPGRVGKYEFSMSFGATDVELTNIEFTKQTVPETQIVAVDYSKYTGYGHTPGVEIFKVDDVITVKNENGDEDVSYKLVEDKVLEDPTRTGYVFNGYIFIPETNTFVAQWLNDGGEDPAGEQDGLEDNDNIPNIYQTVVNYKINFGTWGNDENTVITEVLTYFPAGEMWTARRTNTINVELPTSMTPVFGATGGSWLDGEPRTSYDSLTDGGKEYTYTFEYQLELIDLTYTGQDENGMKKDNVILPFPSGANINIDLDGGSGSTLTDIDNTQVEVDGTIIGSYTLETDTVLSNPTKENYTFNGFVYDENTHTLKAIWVANAYMVHYETNGGTTIDSISVEFGEFIPVGIDPVKDGFKFDGWYQDAELTKLFDFENTTMPANDITLYAKYTSVDGNASVDTNDSTTITGWAALFIATSLSGLYIYRRKYQINK